MRQSKRAQSWDALGFHLRELAENLDFRGFQALSPGLGLGSLRPNEKPRLMQDVNPPLMQGDVATSVAGGMSQPMATASIPQMRNQMRNLHQRPQPRAVEPGGQGMPGEFGSQQDTPRSHGKVRKTVGLMRLAYAWAIDLSLVVTSLALALACAAVALSVGEGQEEFWYEGGPLAWMLKFKLCSFWDLNHSFGPQK